MGFLLGYLGLLAMPSTGSFGDFSREYFGPAILQKIIATAKRDSVSAPYLF